MRSLKPVAILILVFGLLQLGGCGPGGGRGEISSISVTGFSHVDRFNHFGKISVDEFATRRIVDYNESDLSDLAQSEAALYLSFELDFESSEPIGWSLPSLISNAHATSCPDPEVLNPVAAIVISRRSLDGGETILSPSGYYQNYALSRVSPMSELLSAEFLQRGNNLVLDMNESELTDLSADDVFVVVVDTHAGQQFFAEIPVIPRP